MNKPAERASLKVEVEKSPLKAPFRITGYTFNELDVVAVTLEQAGHIGRGEAAGVYYLNDDVQHIVKQIESVRPQIEAGVDRAALQRLLPAGGPATPLTAPSGISMPSAAVKRHGRSRGSKHRSRC